jgi:hypothetical protein
MAFYRQQEEKKRPLEVLNRRLATDARESRGRGIAKSPLQEDHPVCNVSESRATHA